MPATEAVRRAPSYSYGYNPRIRTSERLTLDLFKAAEKRFKERHGSNVHAFLTMEIYDGDGRPGGGGLGTLSADKLKEYAERGAPVVGVSIAHTYIQRQKFSPEYWQEEVYDEVDLENNPNLVKLGTRATINIQGRPITAEAYGKLYEGPGGDVVPIYLLSIKDCEVEEFRRLVQCVYPGKRDPVATFAQQMVLSFAGPEILKARGINVKKYILNDGHHSLIGVKLARDMGLTAESMTGEDLDKIRSKIHYISHTLVADANDSHPRGTVEDMVRESEVRGLIYRLASSAYAGELKPALPPGMAGSDMDTVLMSMFLAGNMNAVSQLNGELLAKYFERYAARMGLRGRRGITNAVHWDWAVPPFVSLYDAYVAGWRREPGLLQQIVALRGNPEAVKAAWGARMEAKLVLVKMVEQMKEAVSRAGLDPDLFARDLALDVVTLGFARRCAPYKRHNLIVEDPDFLLTAMGGKLLQLVYAGKAHPQDDRAGGGKANLQHLLQEAAKLSRKHGNIFNFVFLPDYDVNMARILIAGVDVWLNSPIWGLEASGTSPMCAIINMVLLLSTFDGCVPEILSRGDAGWKFGRESQPTKKHPASYAADSAALYTMLPMVLDAYYGSQEALRSGQPSIWSNKMFGALQAASYFLTPRMGEEYVQEIGMAA